MQGLKQPRVLARHPEPSPGMQPQLSLCQHSHTSPALVTH